MKTVYIMGAGTSKEAGAPLVEEFFKEAISIKNGSKLDDNAKKRFSNVLTSREKYLPNSNIEDFFSYVDLRLNTGTVSIVEFESVRNDLVYMISKVLDVKLEGPRNQFGTHIDFLNSLSPSDNTIITFNWDILFDISCPPTVLSSNTNYGCDYFDLDNQGRMISKSENISLLKLHGSLNWLYCSVCKKLFSRKNEKVLHSLFEQEDFNCNCKKPLESFIIPPTSTKLEDINKRNPLKSIWSKAFTSISNADRIVIIGYSFSETDVHFKLFLRGALHANKKPIEIEVVNRPQYLSEKIQLEERYRKVFSSRKDLEVKFTYSKFSDFVKSVTPKRRYPNP